MNAANGSPSSADKRYLDLLKQGFMKSKRSRATKLKPVFCCNNGHQHTTERERDACDASLNPRSPGILR